MTLSTATPNITVGAGYLLWAPIGSSEPTPVASGSKFTDSWPVAWIGLGATTEGSAFSYETKVEPITVAELLDPIAYKSTERTGSISFALADDTLANMKRVLNGGTLTVVSGTGATTISTYTPPVLGAEVRCMLGWESLDNDIRLVMYQCFQGGNMTQNFKKAPDIAAIPATFNFEMPSSGIPWKKTVAGTAHG
jgi:hypothetical protein